MYNDIMLTGVVVRRTCIVGGTIIIVAACVFVGDVIGVLE